MTPFLAHPFTQGWSRRDWLIRNSALAMTLVPTVRRSFRSRTTSRPDINLTRRTRVASQAKHLDLGPAQTLARQAVDLARSAGASYADVRLTRTVGHAYWFGGGNADLNRDVEIVGIGVRALVNGYWGFASCPWWTSDAVTQLVHDAVAQARSNAKGLAQTVDLERIPVTTGTWSTPITIDPFQVPIEQKLDFMMEWQDIGLRHGVQIPDPLHGSLEFMRQERIVATSDGTLVTQRCYSTEGRITIKAAMGMLSAMEISLTGLEPAALGWEHVLNAKIPEQMVAGLETLRASQTRARPVVIGRYTLVCDGSTMAALVDATLGYATQLDRALGYEANAGGTSYLDDPLGMVGHFQVAAPSVTLTANRSAPAQLATVRWDDEGVEPQPFTLVKDGVLVDFQTTREQAAWLVPYYQRQGRPAQSHGCAAAEDALVTTLQHPPNFALAPTSAAVRLEDLIADVPRGILVTNGQVAQPDAQARNGLLLGTMQEIVNGRLGNYLTGGAVFYHTQDLWTRLVALGGPTTIQRIASAGGSAFFSGGHGGLDDNQYNNKGQPVQITRHSITAPAAILPNQAINAVARKA